MLRVGVLVDVLVDFLVVKGVWYNHEEMPIFLSVTSK